MAQLDYEATFAGVPFCADAGMMFKADLERLIKSPQAAPPTMPQPVDFYDEIDRLIPFRFLQEFSPPANYPNRFTDALAVQWPASMGLSRTVRPGEFFYPTGACRWSVWRGFALSSMVKEMLAQTQGRLPKTFKLKQVPAAPGSPQDADYTVETNLYMLPPRPLVEHGGGMDGLFLVTLVDERYYPASTFRPAKGITWQQLIAQLGSFMGIGTITYSAISAAYGPGPEADSQFWANFESANFLLDAVAYNLGRMVVRAFDGTYSLLTPAESLVVANASRGNAGTVVRVAGGDIFYSGTQLPTGSLIKARNAAVPASVTVTFPRYVQGDDPVPHFLNPRTAAQTPSAWIEDSYGDAWLVSIPITSGGSLASGLVGTGETIIHSTAKALSSGEVQASSGVAPLNASGLTALAMQLAGDHYASQLAAALDEVYPGVYAWTPEGIHDVVWTYSKKAGLATTRVFRSEWNQAVREMQHSAVALSGYTNVPKGVGGPTVAQSWRDTLTASANRSLGAALASGAYAATLDAATGLPATGRWRGIVSSGQSDQETILFEGTSGGVAVGIVWRGIDGSIQQAHNNGAGVNLVQPNLSFGTNLVTVGSGMTLRQGAWSSGGIIEAILNLDPVTATITSGSVGSGAIASGAIQNNNFASGVKNVFSGMRMVWPPWVLVLASGQVVSVSGLIKIEADFATVSGAIVPGFGGAVDGQILIVRTDKPLIIPHMAAVEGPVYWPLERDYTIWNQDAVILEFDGRSGNSSGIWKVDHPTFAVTWTSGFLLSGSIIESAYQCDEVINYGLSGIATIHSTSPGAVEQFIAPGTITSGLIGSGQVGANHVASGFYVPGIQFGQGLIAGEAISGIKAVCINGMSGDGSAWTSGYGDGVLLRAHPLNAGGATPILRMPAVGILPDNYASGAAVSRIIAAGAVAGYHDANSGQSPTWYWSGKPGLSVWVGSGGTVVHSGGMPAGVTVWQRLGTILQSGLVFAQIGTLINTGAMATGPR